MTCLISRVETLFEEKYLDTKLGLKAIMAMSNGHCPG